MTATVAVLPANVVTVNGRRQWRCPWCGKMLAEVTLQTVLVKHDWRVVAVARPEHVKITCKCHQDSYVDAEVLAG